MAASSGAAARAVARTRAARIMRDGCSSCFNGCPAKTRNPAPSTRCGSTCQVTPTPKAVEARVAPGVSVGRFNSLCKAWGRAHTKQDGKSDGVRHGTDLHKQRARTRRRPSRRREKPRRGGDAALAHDDRRRDAASSAPSRTRPRRCSRRRRTFCRCSARAGRACSRRRRCPRRLGIPQSVVTTTGAVGHGVVVAFERAAPASTKSHGVATRGRTELPRRSHNTRPRRSGTSVVRLRRRIDRSGPSGPNRGRARHGIAKQWRL